MNTVKYILGLIAIALGVSCSTNTRKTEWSLSIDKLNSEAFDLRYKDIDGAKAKAAEALQLIEVHAPEYYAAKAEAWNTIAYSCFLTSRFDSTRFYLGKIRSIPANYPNKEIEEAITYITEARLLLRECRYAEAFAIYDSTLTIFSGGINGLTYNDFLPLKEYDHARYHWAKSDYLIGNAVLGYYYRDTELSIILQSLDEIEGNPRLHVDTTQLSVLYYTFAGSYEKAITTDLQNFYQTFHYIKKGMDILQNPASRNDYYVANFYQITGLLFHNEANWMPPKDAAPIREYINAFKQEYLVEKFGWDAASVASDSLPLLLLQQADAIFQQCDDPYQNLASNVHLGNYYIGLHDTVTAQAYYLKGIACDSLITAREGHARIWTKQLYNILLKNISTDSSIEEVRHWYTIYSKASDVIAENTKRDYNALRDKAEAEAIAQRSLYFMFPILLVCIAVIVLLYFLNRQNNKLKKARSVLKLRNEELEAAALDNARQYQELQFVQKRLIEQKRMELLTYVVRGISHELSQPLGSITQTLYDTFKDINTLATRKHQLPDEEYDLIVENLNADLSTISRSKDAISDLVNSFRNTIKENIIDPETDFNLSHKLDDIVKVIRPTIKSNIHLVVDCDPEMVIRTFPLLFSQVLTNLISNANQHAFPNSDDPNDTVHITCTASGRNLIIKCIDNGIGIPENELDRLCQPFVSKKQTNLGLGLSLVKNITEQYMKGEISFSSGNGLTVTVVIPGCIITP